MFLVIGITLAVLGTALVDGKLLDVLSGKAKFDDALLADGQVQYAMLFAAACALPVMLALWFAPALVVFQDCSAPAALRASLLACLANWQPIAVYGLLVFFFGSVVPGMATALIALVVPRVPGVRRRARPAAAVPVPVHRDAARFRLRELP